ncbi:MAG: GC-type dockerin domain-anchored protein [Phycisphaerales bacterium]
MTTRFTLGVAAVALLTGSVFAQPQAHWRALQAVNGECKALLVTSGLEVGGNGSPALWLAGDFTQVGTTAAGRVARLNSTGTWASMASFDYMAQALAEHDGGNGPRVYVGGSFNLNAPNGTADCVGSYNGSGWSLLPSGYMLSWCNSLTSYQLPGQPRKLLVSGSPVGGDNYCRAIGPNGWESPGGDFITVVDDAIVYDDGSGSELFTANGTFNGVNKFNGTRRAMLGGNCYQSPQCFASVGEGSSKRLIVGGTLNACATIPVTGLAQWDGTNWSSLGGTRYGIWRNDTAAGTAHCMTLWDDGTGEKLWVGGQFIQVGSLAVASRTAAQNIAAWDPATGAWSVPAAGGVTGLAQFGFYNGVETMAVFDFDGPGGRPPSLVIGGQFTNAGGVTVSNLAVLDAAWCGTADLGRQGGIPKPDGRLDNNDFIAFISLFFAADVRADVGVQGGGAGHDGQFDNNDFIAFIGAFFTPPAGC